MRLNKRFLTLIIVTPLLVFITALLSFAAYLQVEKISEEIEAHAFTQNYLQNILVDLLNAETGQRGYLLTDKDVFLQPYYLALKDMKIMDEEFKEIKLLNTLSQPQQNELERLITNRFSILEHILSTYRAGNKQEAIAIIKKERGKLLMDSIRHIIDPAIISLDKKLIKKQSLLSRYSVVILGLVFLTFLIVLVVCVLFYQSVSEEVENRDLMNKTLEEKNKQLKDFTHQSYHQLKTPLRSIAGFLQLLEKKADKNLDDEAKEMIAYSVDACEKMNEQIDEIRAMYLK